MGFTHENTGKLAQFVQTQEAQETFEYRIMGKFRRNSQNQTVIFGHILHIGYKVEIDMISIYIKHGFM